MIPFQVNSDADHGLSPGSLIPPPLSPPEEPLLAPIWQWPPNWQCPMLGTGLGIGEQRRIFKRPQKIRRMDAYSLHQALMTIVGDENKISQRIDRLLRRKFQRPIAATEPLSPDEFLNLWRCKWQGPEGLGLFYVAAARREGNRNMSTTFQLSAEHRGDTFYIFLAGDFDGDSAWQLINTLMQKNPDGHQVMIDARQIRRVEPFGAALLKNLLTFNPIRCGRLYFDKIPADKAKNGDHRLFDATKHPAGSVGGCRSRASIR